MIIYVIFNKRQRYLNIIKYYIIVLFDLNYPVKLINNLKRKYILKENYNLEYRYLK